MVLLVAGCSACAAAIGSVCWAIVKCAGTRVTRQLGRQALEECPPDQRAAVLLATAELAGKVGADRTPGKSITLLTIGRRRDE
jgi:hypothetical protein